MKYTSKKDTKVQRLETENKIIDGTIADGDEVVAALYDAKLYPSKEMYDQWVDLQCKLEPNKKWDIP